MSVGASIVVAGVEAGVCRSVSRAGGVEGSIIYCAARNSKERHERRSVGSAPAESP